MVPTSSSDTFPRISTATIAGTNARINGLTVGGKTGTAQTTPDRPPYAWFTSFAENDNRKIAVAVFVESANIPRSEIGGNVVAAPIAKSVMQALM